MDFEPYDERASFAAEAPNSGCIENAAFYELPFYDFSDAGMYAMDSFEGPSEDTMNLATQGFEAAGNAAYNIGPLTDPPRSLRTGLPWQIGATDEHGLPLTDSRQTYADLRPFDDKDVLAEHGLGLHAADVVSKDTTPLGAQIQDPPAAVPALLTDELAKTHIFDLVTEILQYSCSQDLLEILRVLDQVCEEVGRRRVLDQLYEEVGRRRVAACEIAFSAMQACSDASTSGCPAQQGDFIAVIDHMSTLSLRDGYSVPQEQSAAMSSGTHTHAAGLPQAQLAPIPPIFAAELSPCAAGARCEWNNCGAVLPSTSTADVRKHFEEKHFRALVLCDAAEKERRMRCQWAGCRTGRPVLLQNMDRHIRTSHLGATAVACPVCGGWFSRRDSCDRHVKTHHPLSISGSWAGGGCHG